MDITNRYTTINHAAFATSDMDLTIHYWRDLLGMRVVATLGKKGNRQYFFRIADNGFITFFEWSDVKAAARKHHGEPVKGPFIFDHISIGVGEQKSLFQMQDELEAAGFPVSDVIDHGFIHSIYTFDPNGIPLEFSWMTGVENISEKPKLMDPDPVDALANGTHPVKGCWPPVTNPTDPSQKIIVPGQGAV
jgi:catechol 2,3-dioxygenase-like lactoylglutathione lyase family enzyme